METEEILEPQADETPAPPAETEGDSGTPETEFEAEEAAAEPEKPIKGVQKRIDELVKQREDERRDKGYWRQMAMQGQQPAAPAPAPGPETFPDLPKPKSDDYETYDEYVEALADWKAETKWRPLSPSPRSSAQVWQLYRRPWVFPRGKIWCPS